MRLSRRHARPGILRLQLHLYRPPGLFQRTPMHWMYQQRDHQQRGAAERSAGRHLCLRLGCVKILSGYYPGSCKVVPCPVPLSDVSNFERKDNLVALCGHLAGQLHPSPLSDAEARYRRNVTCIPIAHVRRLVYQASRLLMRRNTTGKIRDGDERRPAALWQQWDVLCCR
jgi:hypothetical protein